MLKLKVTQFLPKLPKKLPQHFFLKSNIYLGSPKKSPYIWANIVTNFFRQKLSKIAQSCHMNGTQEAEVVLAQLVM